MSGPGRTEAEIRSTLLGSSWYIPALPVATAGLAFLAEGTIGHLSMLGIGLLGIGLLVAAGVATSRVELRDKRLSARFFTPWRREVALDRLASVRSRRSKASLGTAPALDLVDREGRRLTLRLGWWRHESELLGVIDDAASTAGADVEPDAATLLAERPDGRSWEPGRRRRAAKRALDHPELRRRGRGSRRR